MKKNRIILIIAITLLILGIICVCLFFTFDKNEKLDTSDKKDKEEVENQRKDGYDEFGNKIVVVYDNKDEVYNDIVNEYLADGETITETREENGCWYYKSSNGREEYEYCVAEPVIRVHVREYVTMN